MTQQAKADRGVCSHGYKEDKLTGAAGSFELAWDAQRLCLDWARRRQDDAVALCRAARDLSGCKDVGAATDIYVDWWGGVLQRMLTDIGDVHNEALRLTQTGQQAMISLSATAAEAMQPHAPT